MLDIEQQNEQSLRGSIDEIDEKALALQPSLPAAYERTVPTRRKLIALLGYFACNVGLTIYNKAVLGKFSHPWLLTAIHAASSSIGCTVMLCIGRFHTTKLTMQENVVLLGFSLLFTINIAVSNVSLAMVSIPFHQVVRGTTPLFTTLIYRMAYGRTFSRSTYLSLLPIVLGVTIATYGDINYTPAGFAMTLLGVILAATKTIVTNRMLTGRLALSPLEVLYRMSPLACVQSLLIAILQGELSDSVAKLKDGLQTISGSNSIYQSSSSSGWSMTTLLFILMGNGTLAFILNVSSFSTNKLAGALTMTVCANVKQCLTIVLGIALFGTAVTTTNLWGIAITLAGGASYSFAELKTK